MDCGKAVSIFSFEPYTHDSAEAFGFLATLHSHLSARSYNAGYTAHCVRPNPDFVGTSYSPIPLSAPFLQGLCKVLKKSL